MIVPGTPGPWEWGGVAVTPVDESGPWMEWQPMDPYMGEDADKEYHEDRKAQDGAFIAAAPQIVADLRASLVEMTAKMLLYRDLYTWRAAHDPEPIIQSWDNVQDADRAAFREQATRMIATGVLPPTAVGEG